MLKGAEGLSLRKCLLIICVALLAQFLINLVFLDGALRGDEIQYHRLAVNLMEGKGFTIDGRNPSVDRTPGYPLFLAGVYSVFGPSSKGVVRGLQALLWAGACILFYWIGAKAFGQDTGFLGALFISAYPPLAAMASFLQTEVLFTFLLALSLAVLILAFQRERLEWYALTGLILALTTYVRPTTAFLIPFLMVVLAFWRRGSAWRMVRGLGLAFLIMILVFVPWTVRNYKRFGMFIPLSNMGGITFWVGSYIPGGGYYDNSSTQYELVRLIAKAQGVQFTEGDLRSPEWRQSILVSYSPEVDRVLLSEAWGNIRRDPIGYLALIPRKLLWLWVGSYSPFFQIRVSMADLWTHPELRQSQAGILVWKLVILGCSAIILLLGLVGIGLMNKQSIPAFLLAAIIGYFTLFHVIQTTYSRLGLPAVPSLIIFATYTLRKLLSLNRCAFLTYLNRNASKRDGLLNFHYEAKK
jgi:4-amino-4-deoxy-L-arabinose transferase-like glycosyltransferase